LGSRTQPWLAGCGGTDGERVDGKVGVEVHAPVDHSGRIGRAGGQRLPRDAEPALRRVAGLAGCTRPGCPAERPFLTTMRIWRALSTSMCRAGLVWRGLSGLATVSLHQRRRRGGSPPKAPGLPRTTSSADDLAQAHGGKGRSSRATPSCPHIEVDKARQILMVVKKGAPLGILAVCTGKGPATRRRAGSASRGRRWPPARPIRPEVVYWCIGLLPQLAIHAFASVPAAPGQPRLRARAQLGGNHGPPASRARRDGGTSSTSVPAQSGPLSRRTVGNGGPEPGPAPASDVRRETAGAGRVSYAHGRLIPAHRHGRFLCLVEQARRPNCAARPVVVRRPRRTARRGEHLFPYEARALRGAPRAMPMARAVALPAGGLSARGHARLWACTKPCSSSSDASPIWWSPFP